MNYFGCTCGPFGHRFGCESATEEDRARWVREDTERLERHFRGVLADMNREAQRIDKAVPRRKHRW